MVEDSVARASYNQNPILIKRISFIKIFFEKFIKLKLNLVTYERYKKQQNESTIQQQMNATKQMNGQP